MSSEESGASVSLLPALSLAAPDTGQKASSQPPAAICSAPGPQPPSSPHPSPISNSPLLSSTISLSHLGHIPSPHQAHVTRPQKSKIEFKELGLSPKNQQHSPRKSTTEGVLESSPVWVSIAPLPQEGRARWASDRAGRGAGVALDGVRGPCWPLCRHYILFRVPQRSTVMVLPSSMSTTHPALPSVPRSRLPGERLGQPALLVTSPSLP